MPDSNAATVACPRPPATKEAPAGVVPRGRVVAFITDDQSGDALSTGLEGISHKFEIKRGGIRQATKFMQHETEVRAIIVDIADCADPIADLEALARVCPPEVMVAAIGTNPEIAFYRLLITTMGVTEYLPKPITRDAVQTVLRPHMAEDEAGRPAPRQGHIIAICGAQGGAGATTLTVNLALQLAEVTKGTVAILDLNLQNGETGVLLGVQPGTGLRSALEEPERADSLLLERVAIEVKPRVRLIAANEAIDTDLRLTAAGMHHLLALLVQKFNYIVVDMPMPVPTAIHPVIAAARHVFVLLEPEVTGLRNARALRALVTDIAGVNRVFTVVNRVNCKGGLSQALVEKALGTGADFTLPNFGRKMLEAVNTGVPAIYSVPALRQSLACMVREISGIETTAPRSFLKSLFRS